MWKNDKNQLRCARIIREVKNFKQEFILALPSPAFAKASAGTRFF
jgi:hypothetical protein